MAEFASNAKANTGVALGSTSLGLSVLNTLGNGLVNGFNWGGNGNGNLGCILQMQQHISALESRNAMLASEQASEVKMADIYERLATRINHLEEKENHYRMEQAVINSQITSNISVMQDQLKILNGLTRTYIPISHITPLPMKRFNSWEEPTAPEPSETT